MEPFIIKHRIHHYFPFYLLQNLTTQVFFYFSKLNLTDEEKLLTHKYSVHSYYRISNKVVHQATQLSIHFADQI